METIILLSGGLDSAVAAAWAKKEWHSSCLAVCFDYDQRHRKEVNHSRSLAQWFGWPWRLVTVQLPVESALVSKKGDVNAMVRGYPASFVPARNLIMLSYTASLAWNYEAKNIVGGWNIIDYSGYPDCRSSFMNSCEETIQEALGSKEYRIHSPLIALDKKEIIKLGVKLKVPFEMTWSCYEGGRKPCGECGSCKFRAKGFEEAGYDDPLISGWPI